MTKGPPLLTPPPGHALAMPGIGDYPPHIVADWQANDFSSWTLGGAWNVNGFSSLRGGAYSALWNNANGVGVYPNQSVDPDYIGAGTAKEDVATSPAVDLSLFSDGWAFRFWVVFRPNTTPPTLGGVSEVPPERLRLLLAPSVGDPIELDPNLLDDATALSRINGSPWWWQKWVTPSEAVQAAILGDPALVVKLSLRVGPRDATDYGIGIERVLIDVTRGAHEDSESDTLAVHYFPGLTRLHGVI